VNRENHDRAGPAPKETDRFSRTIRLVRWVELLGVVFGEAVRAVLRDSSYYVSEAELVLLLSALMVAFNIWADTTGRHRLIDRSTLAGISVDAAFITGIVAVTGGTDSWFVGLYAVLIVCVAARHGLRGALPAAAASAALCGLTEIGRSDLSFNTATNVVSHVTYLFLLAWVTGELTEAFRYEADRRARSERERERMESDLMAAQRVQNSLLPRSLPEVPGLEVAVRYSPAGVVGGDIYDFLSHGNEEVGFVVADVSGHSLPAALLVAAAKSALHDAASHPPEKLVSQVNARMLRDGAADQFLTLVYARINAATGRLRLISAGHPPPVLLRSGHEPQPLAADGIVLGVTADGFWREARFQLEAGDTLALYSDGLTERRNATGRVATVDDWFAALKGMRPAGSAEDTAEVIWEISETLGTRTDDASLVVVRYLGPQLPVEATLGSWL
jgi:serine phosphatase RsbU (regulator of sigma subunit)